MITVTVFINYVHNLQEYLVILIKQYTKFQNLKTFLRDLLFDWFPTSFNATLLSRKIVLKSLAQNEVVCVVM